MNAQSLMTILLPWPLLILIYIKKESEIGYVRDATTQTTLLDMLATSAQWLFKKVTRFLSMDQSRPHMNSHLNHFVLDQPLFKWRPLLTNSFHKFSLIWLISTTRTAHSIPTTCNLSSHTSIQLQTRKVFWWWINRQTKCNHITSASTHSNNCHRGNPYRFLMPTSSKNSLRG